MNVTLPKELEEFVQSKVSLDGYPDASAVVAEALREFRSKTQNEPELERLRSLPDGTCPPELKAILMEAVRGAHHPLPFDYFDQLRHHLRAKPGAQ